MPWWVAPVCFLVGCFIGMGADGNLFRTRKEVIVYAS